MLAEMVRAYVESLLEQLTGQDRVTPDHDGDYPVRYQGALYHVRLVGDVDPVVQVFAIAVAEVKSSPELLAELNDLNTRIRFARAFWVRDQVLVEADLVGPGVGPESFTNACRAVAVITDQVGAGLAERHGGRTAFADEQGPEALDARGHRARHRDVPVTGPARSGLTRVGEVELGWEAFGDEATRRCCW